MHLEIVEDGSWYFGLFFLFWGSEGCYCGDSDLVL